MRIENKCVSLPHVDANFVPILLECILPYKVTMSPSSWLLRFISNRQQYTVVFINTLITIFGTGVFVSTLSKVSFAQPPPPVAMQINTKPSGPKYITDLNCAATLSRLATSFGAIKDVSDALALAEMRIELPLQWNSLPSGLIDRVREENNGYYLPIAHLMQDRTSYLAWVLNMRGRVIAAAARSNIKCSELSKSDVRDEYLDQVIRTLALRHNFNLDNNHEPFHHNEQSDEAFMARLENKQLFYDDVMASSTRQHELSGTITHGQRTHALQILFSAEYIPQFADMISQIGRTKDAFIWSKFFENPYSEGIQNVGLFNKYTMQFLTFNDKICAETRLSEQ